MPATDMVAVYEADEEILRLERKLDLPDGARVKVVIEPLSEEGSLARRIGGDIVIDDDAARCIVEHEGLYGDE